jgi:hypothetical protein
MICRFWFVIGRCVVRFWFVIGRCRCMIRFGFMVGRFRCVVSRSMGMFVILGWVDVGVGVGIQVEIVEFGLGFTVHIVPMIT